MTNEKKIVVFGFASHFIFHYHEIAFPVLAIPLTLSLGLSLKDVLELGFPMYLLFGLSALPWGIVADRLSNRLTLILGFLGCAAGSFLMAACSTPAAMMLSLAVIGLFSSVCHPAGMGLISHGAANRGAALGVFSIAGTIGLIVGPFLAGVLNWVAGWQAAYLVAGVVSLVFGILLCAVPIHEKQTHPRQANSQPAAAFSGATVALFFWIVLLGGLVYRINIIALPAYLEQKAGFLARALHDLLSIPAVSATSTMAAAALTSVIYVAGIFGQLYGGRVSDRHDLKRLYLIFYAVSLALIALMAAASDQWLVAASAGYVFFALGIQPIENSLIAAFTPARWRSTGYGFAAILIFGVGALAVFLVGWTAARWSLGAVYIASGLILAVMVPHIGLLMAWTRGREIRNQPRS